MAAIARAEILKKFHDMVARGQPIVGGGAGTGISAKAEEAGGIDLIIIYNSGRYRMAGRGSAACCRPGPSGSTASRGGLCRMSARSGRVTW